MDKLRSGVQLVVGACFFTLAYVQRTRPWHVSLSHVIWAAGTPGRVHDMINRRAMAVDYIHYFVLDEVSA